MKTKFRLLPEKLTALVPKASKTEDPFPMPHDAVDPAFLQMAPSGEQGRALVRRHCDSLFRRAHGQWEQIFERGAEAHLKTWARLMKDYSYTMRQLVTTDRTIRDPKPGLTLPSGEKRWRASWWGFVLLALAIGTWINIARFAADETQDWLRAFLYAAPVLFIPLALKWADDQVPSERWTGFRYIAAGVFLVGLLAFDISFTWRFAYAPRAEDIANGTVGAGTWDARVQLLSQLILEPLLALVIFFKLREALVSGTSEIPNPDYQARSREAAELEAELRKIDLPLAQYEGLLAQLRNAKEAFADKWEARWRQFQHAREEAENDRKEEERDFQARQARRHERQQHRYRLLDSWAPTPTRNGDTSSRNHSNRL